MLELKSEAIWFDQRKFEEAESHYQRSLVKTHVSQNPQRSSIVDQIAKARETIKQTLQLENAQSFPDTSDSNNADKRLSNLEKENQDLKEVIKVIQSNLSKLEARVAKIEISKGSESVKNGKAEQPKPVSTPELKVEEVDDDDDDDDEDLFGSDDDDEKEKLKQIRLAQYEAKKATKKVVIAKSNIILDVKPWDDETDMAELEKCVRSVSKDGLLWGQSKLVEVGYGIKKLQISCVVEDDKVSTDDLEEEIKAFEDYVQSVDIAAFNKV